MPWPLILTAALTIAAFCSWPMTSRAAVFNAAADLLANEVPNGSASNPNGPWTYGGYDDVASPARVFTVIPFVAAPPNPQHEDSWLLPSGQFQGWANNTGDVVPAITVNTTAGPLSPCCGIDPIGSHKIFMHPGPGGRSIFDDITVRWTAPGAGAIDVRANWIQRHFAPQRASVLINGVLVFTALATTGAGTTYSATSLPVAAGDIIDFVLDQGPTGYGGGSTEFDAAIDFTPLDIDGDGVPDVQDVCPNSNLSPTVIIDGCNSGVPNTLFANGCTISDLVAQCGVGASNHGQFVSCVAHLTNALKKQGSITGKQDGAIQSCAGKSSIGK
jgi:hypothetical protein